MTDKYYKPDLTDLFIGYEYMTESWFQKGTLNPRKIHEEDYLCDRMGDSVMQDFLTYFRNDKIYTLYLTKEQIEAEGWKPLDEISPFTNQPYKWQKIEEIGFNNSKVYTLEFYNGKQPIQIHLQTDTGYINLNQYIYSGRIPSINEFRKLIKLLNI